MPNSLKALKVSVVLTFLGNSVFAGQFVVELYSPLEPPAPGLLQAHGVEVENSLAAGSNSYAIFAAEDAESLSAFLDASSIQVEKISEVIFVNSPMLGGGAVSGPTPKPGHQVFVIERPIPGVGFFGLDKKQRISANSVAAMDKLGDIIEWDKSYLTSEGTYCLYRADSSATLREHGALAGAPIGKITQVEQMTYSQK